MNFCCKSKIDQLYGIYCSNYKNKLISWEKIVAIIKFDQTGMIRQQHLIGVALQEPNGEIFHGRIFKSGNKFKCLHSCEKMVSLLKKDYGAKGGHLWCGRPLKPNGKILDDFSLFQCYLLCRILADKMNLSWFAHTDDEEVETVLSFFKYDLVRNGTELAQIENAINDAGFHIMKDGSVHLFRSSGYRLLSDARVTISSEQGKSIHFK